MKTLTTSRLVGLLVGLGLVAILGPPEILGTRTWGETPRQSLPNRRESLEKQKWAERKESPNEISEMESQRISPSDLLDHPPDAIRWLLAFQSPQGHWDADGFGRPNAPDGFAPVNGAGHYSQDVAVTSLATLAILAHGSYTEDPKHRSAVEQAVQWLKGFQDPVSGFLGIRSHSDSMLQHALACMALSEAARFSQNPATLKAATEGFAFHARMRVSPWDLITESLPLEKRPTFAWVVLASEAGETAGATIWVAEGIPRARQSLMMRASNCSPSTRAERRERELHLRNRQIRSCGLGAALHYALLERSVTPPRYSVSDYTSIDWESVPPSLETIYFLSILVAKAGSDPLREWKSKLRAMELPKQRKDGPYRGSFDPVTADAIPRGRVYSTALMALIQGCLHQEHGSADPRLSIHR